MDQRPEITTIEEEQRILQESVNPTNSCYWQTHRKVATAYNFGPEWSVLHFIGGLDLSCPKDDQSKACAALVVIRLPNMEVVYEDSLIDNVSVPYIPGCLGAREYPLMGRLLDTMRKNCPQFFPQVVLVDGNGILHPRGCGSACYVGVRQRIPCIGVAKTLMHLSSWKGDFEKQIHVVLKEKLTEQGATMDLIHENMIVGRAMIASRTSKNPVFVSVGHDIDLDTAAWVVNLCTNYRIPEPIRLADILSRKLIEKERVGKLEPQSHAEPAVDN